MPSKTKTLFHTLEIGAHTFIIESVSPIFEEDTLDLSLLPPDRARALPQTDPWGDRPITYASDGRGLYSPTVQVPQLNGARMNTVTADSVVYATGRSSGRE